VQPSDGKILIAGAFDKYNSESKNCIVRLNTDGTTDQNFNVNGAIGANRVIYDLDLESPTSAQSNILFCGEFTAYNGNSNTKKMARMKYDGSLEDTFNIGSGTLDSGGTGNLHNYIAALKRQSDGKIIVGGRFTSFNGITAENITRIQGNNGLQAKSSSNTYTSESEVDINVTAGNVKVYPNPTNGLINIDLSSEEILYTKVTVYNILGAEVYTSSIRSKEINQIDISNLPTGYYIAKINNENSSIQVKLVKK
jgi:hypothetical protein